MKKIFFMIIAMMSYEIWAHPTSYGGALSLMSMNTSHKRMNTIHYSPNHWSSIGVTSVSNDRADIYYPRVGLLAKRWNGDDYQANIYLTGGYGKANFKDQRLNEDVYNAAIQADWEDREYFIEGKYNRLESDNYLDDMYSLRVGYAPYIAEYDELNIWFMLQHMNHPRDVNKHMTIPMVRMFYKNVLWELGASTDGAFMINFAIRQFIN